MEAKISKALTLFKIFGVYYEVVTPSRLARIISRFFLIFWFSVSIFLILQSIYRGLISKYFSNVDFVLHFYSIFFMQVAALMTLMLTYKWRKHEREMLRNLSEVDDLIEKKLNIKIDHGRFTRNFCNKLFGQMIFFAVAVLFRFLNEEDNYPYKSHEIPVPEIPNITALFFFNKYVFYTDLMHFRMKV